MLIDSTLLGMGSFAFDGPLQIDDVALRIEQMGSGRLFIYVNKNALEMDGLLSRMSISVSGRTADGHALHITSLRYFDSPNDEHCFTTQRVLVGSLRRRFAYVQMRITNVVMPEPVKHIVDIASLPCGVFLERLERYNERELFMRQTQLSTATARLIVRGGGVNRSSFMSLRTDLTMALSVVQGRKVQTICDAAFSAKGDLVWMDLGETLTKDYSPSNFCFNPETRYIHTVPLLAAAECFENVRAFRNTYDPAYRILNSWFDARVQADYMEARTLKYVVVGETLRHIVDEAIGTDHTSPVPKRHWRDAGKRFRPELETFLKDLAGVTEDGLNHVCGPNAWGNLNRLGLKTQLTRVLTALGVTITEQRQRIDEFVEVRNKIIHQFNYMRKEDFREKKWPVRNAASQHYAIVASFIDEVLLRLCGLSKHVEKFHKTERADSKRPRRPPDLSSRVRKSSNR